MPPIEVIEGDSDAESLFNRFRQRVFEGAFNTVERHTVPLSVDNGEKLIDIRSGVLLQIADMHFLVTAGHYMVSYHEQGFNIGIALPVKGSHPILLVNEHFWTTKDDQEDISVARLTESVVNYIKDHVRYIRLTSIMSRQAPDQGKGMYLILGYPEALLGSDDTGIKKMESWKYLTLPYRGDYARVENYNPRLHLVLDYHRDTYNSEGQRIHPPGMSGGGIWFVGNHITHALFREDDFKLVAIQNCWHRKFEYAKGTWIDDVLLVLWKYYPDTHGPLKIAGFNFSGR